jgi:hypothetical protein
MTKIGDEIQELIDGVVLPPLEDGDITINKLCEKGLTANAWRLRMKHVIDGGTWKIVWKRTDKGIRIATYAKVVIL